MKKAKRFNKMTRALALTMVGVWTMMAVITGVSQGQWVSSALFAVAAALAAFTAHWASEALETIKKIEEQENEW